MSNLYASGGYPYVQFQPSETSSVQHTDQEYTDGSGNSSVFRAYNAYYDLTTSLWTLLTSSVSAEAYATVQEPDGSIHYYSNYNPATSTFEPSWEYWFGSGNNAVFNAVDYGLSASDPTGTDNQLALQYAINAAFFGGGGTVVIPPGSYKINGTCGINFTGVPGDDHGLIIAGASGDTEFAQQDITADTFSFTGLGSGRGVRIRDLRITYATASDTPDALAAAVRGTSTQNLTCERVYFNNCPQAFYTDGNLCGIFGCTIYYNNFSASDTVVPTMVSLNGAEEYIQDCVIYQQPQGGTSDGPTGCVGVLVNTVGAGYYITNSHISDFTQGIVVEGGSNLTRLYCEGVCCESWTNSLVVTQPSETARIEQINCVDCLFEQSNGSTDDTGVGILIGTIGGDDNAIGEIFLNNCTCFQWPVAGVLVYAGQSIVITGGRYGSNAYPDADTGGITIAGGSNITITGADLTPKLLNPDFPTQAYALAVIAAVSGLFVRGCNMTGYSTGPIYTSSAGTEIEISDCAGYNDQRKILATSMPTSASLFYNNTYGYYGPVEIYAAPQQGAITEIALDGTNTELTQGSFYVQTGEYGAITWHPIGVVPPSFIMIGK